ncbi:hypothetical protein TNIN_231321 [Trichonephila inaurata madagascariensis]|uniref:60S ribosomal protein L9 n=1 Tax=Trichonephila inaurata madagascariensis TaxID=2747483 RepID=A0A8X6XXM8_9ARAC|nr:hypothetical protein TNIN_231321 [Trichonephila inaurata madagascariensis]
MGKILRILVRGCSKYFRMKTIPSSQVVKIPSGVNIKVCSRIVTVKVPHGILHKNLKHAQVIMQIIGRNKLVVQKWYVWNLQGIVNCANCVCTLIENMINEYMIYIGFST